MDAKTLTPGADAAPRTLAAGELVWAKPKGRRRFWWPARLLAARPVDAARDAAVAYFGDPGAPPGPAVQVRRFADPDADGMARGSTGRAFLAAVEEAHAGSVAALRASLTCGCVPPPPPSPNAGVVVGLANLSPAEFLAALRIAAQLGGTPVRLVDRARLKSWVHAFGEGWGPGGAGHYPRRTLEELVDKIDLDVPAGDDREDDEWLTDAKDEHEASEEPQETPAPKKHRAASRMDELDAGEDEDMNDSATGIGSSGKRERKRSKYLSPPYTNLGVFKLPGKLADPPKALAASAAEYDSEVSPDSIVVQEVMSLVLNLAKDVSHGSHFPKAAEIFLRSFRSIEFKCPQTEFYDVHESPVANAVGKVDVEIAAAGVVSDVQTVLKQGKGAAKRSRKKDDDGGSSSSIKRKKRERHFFVATIGCGSLITSAIPIRQVKPEDKRSPMKAGVGERFLEIGINDEKFKSSAFKCETSPSIPETTKSQQKQDTSSDQLAKEKDESKLRDEKNKPSLSKCAIPTAVLGAAKSTREQQVDGFVGKTAQDVDNTFSDQSAKKNDEAQFGDGKSEQSVFKCPISAAATGVTEPGQEQVHQNGVSAVTTVQATDNTLSNKAAKENSEDMVGVTKSEMKAESIPVDVPIRNVQMEATGSEAKVCIDEKVQSVVADLPIANVSREATESKPNVSIDETALSHDADMPVQSIDVNDVPLQNASADVPVQSFGTDVHVSSEPSPMDEDIAQAKGENGEHSSEELHTVQQSYASLQSMVPEMRNKVTDMNGMDVIPVNHALKNELRKDEQPNQKVKLTFGSMANHFSDQAANGTCPDATNSTPKKKKKKKPTQLFVDPAEIIVEFTPGVIMPSREELLSAFSKFGFIIESETNIAKDTHSARVVFGKKAEAENAYKRAEFLGEFGPPFATLKLGDLPPIELSVPSPAQSVASRPPLIDIRKNLEKMILTRHSSLKNATSTDGTNPVSDKLLADMQGLLVQVDKMLSGASASTPP